MTTNTIHIVAAQLNVKKFVAVTGHGKEMLQEAFPIHYEVFNTLLSRENYLARLNKMKYYDTTVKTVEVEIHFQN